MRWNSRMGRWYCSRAYARASAPPSAIAGRRTSCSRERGGEARGSRAFAFEVSNATHFKTRSHRPRPVAFFKW